MFCSIIVPTYNSDLERLGELVASLDAQTLASDRFELIFVDDGSTTELVPHLEQIASSRPNVLVIPMENSGWACRPRNEGTRRASGEWVLYMDHDDVLYPEALERLARFTDGIDADVVNPKEERTKSWSWGWDSFTGDIADITDRGPLAFLPMTPHKLYRREFLLENQISFIEDRRVLWEDVFFNVLAYSRGARIALFSSYPVYHWVNTGSNTSSTYGRSPEELWGTLRSLLVFFSEVLEKQSDIDDLVYHWFRTRILKLGGPDAAADPDAERTRIDYERARALTLEFVPERIDDRLNPVDHRMASLLRADDFEGMLALAKAIDGYTTHTRASDFGWDGDGIAFDIATTFEQDDAELTLLAGDAGPAYAVAGLPSPIGLGDAAASTVVRLSVRGVATRETTPLEAAAPVRVDAGHARAANRVRIGLPELITDRALAEQRFDIAARVQFPIHTTHKAVRIPDEEFVEQRAIIDGRQVGVFRGKEAQLTIAVDTDATKVLRVLEVNVSTAVAITRLTKTVVRIALPGVHAPDDSSIDCTLWITPVLDDHTTWRGPRLAHAATIGSDAAGACVTTTEPRFFSRGAYLITVEEGNFKRRLGVLTVEKNLVQRVAGRLHRES